MMAIVRAYIAARWRIIAAFASFIAIFALLYSLYRLPMEPIFYSSALVAFFGLMYALQDFRAFWHKHEKLDAQRKGMDAGLAPLPPPKDRIERDYQEILSALDKRRALLISETDAQKQNWQDIITLWAHQIKTPLSALRLLADMEREDTLPALRQEIFRIEQYVEMLLSYLRLLSINEDLHLRHYSIERLVKQAVKKLSPVFIHRQIDLRLGDLSGEVITDEKWLEIVLEQVLTNALKYTREGSVSIFAADGRRLVIEDTGIGIYPEDIPRIFERGYTGINGRIDKKASGLGLYLSKSILDTLRHGISVQSQPGKGTRVVIDLGQRELEVE